MTDKIGFLWQDGEKLSARGNVHEALLQFQRAKTLLIAESHCFFSNGEQKEGRIPPVYGEIMTKLTRSIDKNVTFLHNHPVYTLGVSKNYTHKEIKKAYRVGALKYHPDKNKDCDSSCVFTALQAAYETLLVTAAKDHKEDTVQRGDSAADIKPPSRQSSQREQARQSQPPSRSSKNKNAQHTQAPPTKQHVNTDNLNKAARNRDASIASIVSMMTTTELRKVLSKFGFNNLESSSREDLVKKYLALHTHFGKAEPASKQHAPHDTWAEQMRAEMNSARRREQRQHATPRRSASMNDPRHQDADEHRNQRAERLKRELPKMSLSELRRMMHTWFVWYFPLLVDVLSGISMTGCVEKYDLLEKLCAHYGISVDDLILASSATPSATPRTDETIDSSKKAELASERSGRHDRSNYAEKSFTSVFGKSESIPPAPAATSTAASNKSDYLWTKERLREMEAKLHRRGQRQPVSKKPVSEPEVDDNDIIPPCMRQFMDGHADIFKEVRTSDSIHIQTPRDTYSNSNSTTTKNSPAVESVESQVPPIVTPGKGLLDDDSDSFSDTNSSDSGIQWRPEKTSEKYAHVHIPDLPLGGYVSDGSMSEEEIFEDPTLSPSRLKSMRFQRAVQKDIYVNVGVSLLSDDESSDDETPDFIRATGRYKSQSLAEGGSPMSATAWSGVFHR